MEEQVKALVLYRLECSKDNILDAENAYAGGRYKNTLNRCYYAIFNAIRAVNAINSFDSSKHSGVISYFNLNFIEYSRKLMNK